VQNQKKQTLGAFQWPQRRDSVKIFDTCRGPAQYEACVSEGGIGQGPSTLKGAPTLLRQAVDSLARELMLRE